MMSAFFLFDISKFLISKDMLQGMFLHFTNLKAVIHIEMLNRNKLKKCLNN